MQYDLKKKKCVPTREGEMATGFSKGFLLETGGANGQVRVRVR
jgi:hypothetical protein